VSRLSQEARGVCREITCSTLTFPLQSKVPPSILGYTHVGKLVYITQDGEVLVNPSHENSVDIDDSEIQKLIKTSDPPELCPDIDDDFKDENSTSSLRARNKKYEKMIKLVPGPLRDHMPDFYLQPLVRLFEIEKNGKSFEK
jgi:hypothetical protein